MSCTPEQAASRFEISDLVIGFAIALDDRDFVQLRGLLSDDVVWVVGRGKDHIQGGSAVVDYLRSLVVPMSITVHKPTPPIVTFTSNDAASGVVLASIQLPVGGTTTALEVRYHDRYVRRDGTWRLGGRAAETVYAFPLADLPSLLPTRVRPRPAATTSGHHEGQPT